MKKMNSLFPLILIAIFISGCAKKTFFDGPSFYEDGFESYKSFDELIDSDEQYWSFTQLSRAENQISLDTSMSHTGKQSLRFSAVKTDEAGTSKASIAKQNMAFWEGETVQMSAWYYIADTMPLTWLFLMDIEEQTAIGAGPGMRLALVDNQLRVEHKFFEDDILQTSNPTVDFPRNQWINIRWEITLSRSQTGSVRIWQDEELILNTQDNRTLPEDFLYFQQGTKGMFSSFEIGLTANSIDNAATIWVDDILIEKVE